MKNLNRVRNMEHIATRRYVVFRSFTEAVEFAKDCNGVVKFDDYDSGQVPCVHAKLTNAQMRELMSVYNLMTKLGPNSINNSYWTCEEF